MKKPSDFVIGANYWPSKKFVSLWQNFDEEEINADFDKAKSFGIDVLRFFLFWPDFQPTASSIDSSCLEKYQRLIQIAEKNDLKLIPTFLVGHMSGPNYLPGFAQSSENNDTDRVFLFAGEQTGKKPKNLYTDGLMLDAEKLLIRTAVEAGKNSRSIYAWDLSNEIDNIADPTPEEALWWEKQMVETIKAVDTKHPVTHGVHIKEKRGHGFPLNSLLADDMISVHSYPMYEGKQATDVDHIAQTVLFAKSAGKPVLLAEFGLPTGKRSEDIPLKWSGRDWLQPIIDETKHAEFIRDCLQKAIQLGTKGAIVWCFSDYSSDLYDKLPFNYLVHERTFGLFRADGSPKPAAEVLKEFI